MRVPRRAALTIAAAVVASLLPSTAATAAAPPDVPAVDTAASRLETPRYRPTGRLVVRYRAGATAADRAAGLASLGARATVARRMRHLDVEVVDVPTGRPAAAARLRRNPHVLYVEPESHYRGFADFRGIEHDEIGITSSGVLEPGYQAATAGGSGVEIAVIDSGVDATNPDLDGQGKVVDGGDYTGATPSATGGLVPSDPHGTAVATVAAAEVDGTGMVGVAPAASIVAYKALGPDGGSNAAVADALLAAAQRAAAPGSKLKVANLSLGGPFDSRLIRDAISEARRIAPEMVIVVAAGNDGGERPNYPAGDPDVLSVGASGQVPPGSACGSADPTTPWTVTWFSNRGDVDLLAPGRCITAWYGDRLRAVDGTSFASPMVAGIAAGLANEKVFGDRARAALVASAESANASTAPAVASGSGRADGPRAHQLATSGTSFATAFLTRGGQVANLVGRRSVEVLRYDPDPTVPNDPATLVPSLGTVSRLTAVSVQSAGSGVMVRRHATYAVPSTDHGAAAPTLAVQIGSATADSIPLRYVDPADGPEGLPAFRGESVSPTLSFGSRSAYIRTVGLRMQGRLDFGYAYKSGWSPSAHSSDLFFWLPRSSGGTPDAADEPDGSYYRSATPLSGNDYLGPVDGGQLDPGRYAVGWVTFSGADNGTYSLSTTFNAPARPFVTVATPTSSATTGVPFPVSWGPGPSGTTTTPTVRYDVEWRTRTKVGTTWVLGPWQPWLSGTTATSGTFGQSDRPVRVHWGRTFDLRARARDDVDNFGGFSSYRRTVVPVNDNSRSFGYSTGWTHATGRGSRWLADYHYARTARASLTVNYETSQYEVIGDRCAGCGQFKVYVDGAYVTTVDTGAPSTIARQVLWRSASFKGIVAHRLTIVVVGTAGRPRVHVDAISRRQ